MQPGDSVQYVPAEEHALDCDRDGNYPWVLGYKDRSGEVRELSGKQVVETLSMMRRSPDPEGERKKLVFLRPAKTWPATVRAVHDDKADLDIQGVTGGVTLHYNNVPINRSGKPHTCYGLRD